MQIDDKGKMDSFHPQNKTKNSAKYEDLICIHGSGGSAEEFGDMVGCLDRKITAIALDLPGHGFREGPGMDRIRDYAEWVARFIVEKKIRPVLLGHSLGGAIVLNLAVLKPELLSGIILWGTGARLRVLPSIIQGIADNYMATIDLLVELSFAKSTDKSIKDIKRDKWRKIPPHVLLGDYSACNQFDMMDQLDKITVPALVVCGEIDILTPLKYSIYMNKAIKGSVLSVVKDAGHMIHQEKPEMGSRIILNFIKQLK